MNVRFGHVFVFCLLSSVVGICTAAGNVIQQQETSSGSLALSNLDGDDAGDPATPAQSAPVEPIQAPGSVSSVKLESEPRAATPADAANETSGGSTDKSAKYRDNMLNLPLLPNGRPANPAIQRRYLMVKKSDYIGGN